MPTQLLVGPKAPSGKNTIVRPSATSSTLVLARRTVGKWLERTCRHRSALVRSTSRHWPARHPDAGSTERPLQFGREPFPVRSTGIVLAGYVPPEGHRPWESRDAGPSTGRTSDDLVADFMTIDTPWSSGRTTGSRMPEGLLERYNISGSCLMMDKNGTLRGVIEPDRRPARDGRRSTARSGAGSAVPTRRSTSCRRPRRRGPGDTACRRRSPFMRDEKMPSASWPWTRLVVRSGVLSSMDFVTFYAEQ